MGSGAPGSRPISACSTTGRTPSPSTGRGASTRTRSYADYTPGYLYALWPIGLLREVAARWRGRGHHGQPDQAARDHHRRPARLPRRVDGAGAGRVPAPGADRRRGRRLQPDHLVRLRDLGPGGQLRHAVPAPGHARAVARSPRAGRRPRRGRRADQAPARDPRADRRRGHDPARAVAEGRVRRRGRAAPARVRLGAPGHRLDPHPDDGGGRVRHRRRSVRAVRPDGAWRSRRPPPFVESSLLRLVFITAAAYPYLSVNAYNWWALFPVDGKSVASSGGALWMPDSPMPDAAAWGAIGPVPASLVGAALLLGAAVVVAGGRAAPGPAHDPGRRQRPRARLLRRADARPRAVPVPVLRPGRDPVRVLLALADRVRRRRRSPRS